MSGQSSTMSQVAEDTLLAWKVIFQPRDYGDFKIKELFERGYNTWKGDDGVRNEEQILHDAQHFAEEATGGPQKVDVVQNPWVSVDQPGRLVVLCSMGSFMIRNSDALEDYPDHRISLHHYIREVFAYHLYAALNSYGTEADRTELQKVAGECVFGRHQQDDRGPPKGRAISAIKPMDDIDGRVYFEIPLVHANRYCLVRDEEDGLETHVTNNAVYVPFEAMYEPFERYILDDSSGVARYFETAFEKTLSKQNIEKITSASTKLDAYIQKLVEGNHTQKLLKKRRYPERLRCVLKAVHAAPNDIAALGEYQTADDIFEAVEWFVEQDPIDNESVEDPDHDIKKYEQNQVMDFKSNRAIGTFLADHQDHDHVEILEGKVNEYKLSYSPGQVKNVNVSDIEDILELPCMERIDEQLKEEILPRWVLFTYARLILSLENGFGVEEIKEFFSRYPWYDAQTTEYQVGYEKRQRMEGEPPLPIGCNNDNEKFADFCIGRENCDYSIYQSLPFKPSVYGRLPERTSDERILSE